MNFANCKLYATLFFISIFLIGTKNPPVLQDPQIPTYYKTQQLAIVWLVEDADYVRFTAQELLDPKIKSFVEYCERIQGSRCQSRLLSGDRLTKFSRGTVMPINVVIEFKSLSPDSAHEVILKLINPQGINVQDMHGPFISPPYTDEDNTAHLFIRIDPLAFSVGKWSILVYLNDVKVGNGSFEVTH